MNEPNKESSIGQLQERIERLDRALVDLNKSGNVNERVYEELKANIKELYKQTIANVCGIDPSSITDEMIKIATATVPYGGQKKEGNTIIMYDGRRALNDDELRQILCAYLKSNDNNLQNKDETIQAQSRMEILRNKVEQIAQEVNNSNMSQEERDMLKTKITGMYRTTIAEIAGCSPEEVDDALVGIIKAGKKVEKIKEDGTLAMYVVPLTDEEVKSKVDIWNKVKDRRPSVSNESGKSDDKGIIASLIKMKNDISNANDTFDQEKINRIDSLPESKPLSFI